MAPHDPVIVPAAAAAFEARWAIHHSFRSTRDQMDDFVNHKQPHQLSGLLYFGAAAPLALRL
jgi:hypothetical protein